MISKRSFFSRVNPAQYLLSMCCILLLQQAIGQSNQSYDLVIYGATSAGISAAIQGSRMGKKVILIEPSGRIGGLTSGGLGQTNKPSADCPENFIKISSSIISSPRIGFGKKEKHIVMEDKPGLQAMKMRCGLLNLQLL
jgi:heterodisulfide reductase subunit A-like polyferredoxin